ncbi:hypothetical protein OIU78_014173 [Salix suchowensis]|nr:hypothetical protein OIU78_014173 [Salix suchowensis]
MVMLLPSSKGEEFLLSGIFPPGCGPLAVLIFKQNEKFVAASKEKSGDGCLETINRVETKGEDPIVSSDHVNGHVLVKQESAGMLLPEAVCALNDVSVVGSVEASVVGEAVKALEPETADASENLCKVDVIAPAENIAQQNYPPRRRISAVRDFPPFCGPNAPHLNKEEAAKVLIFVQKKSLDQEKSDTEGNPTKEMCIYVKDGDLNESRLESASRMDGDKVRIDSDSSVNKVKVAEENRHEWCIKSPREVILNQHDPNSMAVSKSGKMEVGGQEENPGKDLTVYMEDKSTKRKLLDLSGGKISMCKDRFDVLKLASGREVVQGLSAERNCPWRKGPMVHKPNMLAGDARESKGQKRNLILLKRSKSALKTKINELDKHQGIMKKNSSPTIKVVGGGGQMTVCKKEDYLENGEECDDFRLVARSHNFDVSLPPSCPTISLGQGNDNDAITRNKVRETLRLFQAICRKLLHEEEAKVKERGNTRRRVDLQASKILKEKGKYLNDNSLWDGLTSLMHEANSDAVVEVQNSGFTIDAAQCGGVGRFINHSCSPNLYAQNVLYDHDDKRIPHVMFFAVENIPPLQELTYHYNYMIDQVFDSNGNIKKKSCHCGSPECTGRMY